MRSHSVLEDTGGRMTKEKIVNTEVGEVGTSRLVNVKQSSLGNL